jgi:hypothetical protein
MVPVFCFDMISLICRSMELWNDGERKKSCLWVIQTFEVFMIHDIIYYLHPKS